MTIDLYSATGAKKGTLELPASLFEASMNKGLIHQMILMQQGNARHAIAHVKSRGEVAGSTRKLYQQKGTGRARRGSIRSPLLRGGGKAFGPSSDANYVRDMPKTMRRQALKACLSLQAKNGVIIGLESYPEEKQTKKLHAMLSKMPVELGRRILVVTAEKHTALALSARNIPGVKTILAAYLNPLDVVTSRHIIFLADAVKKAEEVFGGKKESKIAKTAPSDTAPAKKKSTKSVAEKKQDAVAKKEAATAKKPVKAKKSSAKKA